MSPDDDTDDTDDADAPDDAPDTERPDGRPWYRDRTGRGLVAGYLVGTLAFVAVTIGRTGSDGSYSYLLGEAFAVVVPPHVYVFAVLGGLGYVFTRLIRDIEEDTGSLVRAGLTVVAALPLGAGVYLLSSVIVPEATSGNQQADALVAGLVFLTGLYVNLTYKRLGALARRLLPGARTVSRRSAENEG